MAESKEELKSLLMKTTIMASGPIISRQIDGETMEIVTDFISLNSKIAADGDCSPEIKRRLLLGRKAMTNLDSILESRDSTLPTKVHIIRDKVFPVVMYRCGDRVPDELWMEVRDIGRIIVKMSIVIYPK